MLAEIEADIMKKLPTARPGFVKILVRALIIHAKKNNDYNGKEVLFPADVGSLYHDIRRKFGRLHNILASGTPVMVDEKIEDTAIDLGNYAFLLAEELDKLPKRVHMGEEMNND